MTPLTTVPSGDRAQKSRAMLSKVPEVTMYFWIIKILATTVGESFADFLNTTLGFGLTGTTVAMSLLLAVALFFQFKSDRYVPKLYWLNVTLISVAGTLVTDNLTDNLGISLVVSTIVFAVALAIVFAVWYANEKTLSIHSIVTTKREAFYWLAILFTFALGTAAGDLLSERVGLGYGLSALIYGGLIALVAGVHLVNVRRMRAKGDLHDAVLAFWIAYILTRPFGASLGDLLAQSPADGGLGLTSAGTSAIFLTTILGLVIFLGRSHRDQINAEKIAEELRLESR